MPSFVKGGAGEIYPSSVAEGDYSILSPAFELYRRTEQQIAVPAALFGGAVLVGAPPLHRLAAVPLPYDRFAVIGEVLRGTDGGAVRERGCRILPTSLRGAQRRGNPRPLLL